MLDAHDMHDETMSLTPKMIRDEAFKRGWQVWFYVPGEAHMRLQRADGKVLEIYSATPPTTSFEAARAANNKLITGITLQENDIPTPRTQLVSGVDGDLSLAESLIGSGKRVVVKPLDSGHGNGVTVGLSDIESVKQALTFALNYSHACLVQEQVDDAIDIRLSCVDYTFVAAVIRVPARVKGDGVQTIRQLIEAENKSEKRGAYYSRELNFINNEFAERYLGSDIDSIPQAGEWKAVVGTANLGTGGETIDITEDVPGWLIELAEKAARVCRLPVAGVDFLVRKHPAPADTFDELQPNLIEINKCPALFLHEMPTVGKPRNTIARYLDYLETL